MKFEVWDDELARVAQKWADQCADVDYVVRTPKIITFYWPFTLQNDEKRKDPHLFHDPHPQRKVGECQLTDNAKIALRSQDCESVVIQEDWI